MKRIFIFLLILSYSFLLAQEKDENQQDYTDIPSRYGYPINRSPEVSFNYFLDFSGIDWSPQLYLAAAIQNDYLQFTRREDSFYSEYEITFTLRNKNETVVSKTWSNKSQLQDFDLTNSKRDFQYHTYLIDFKKEEAPELKPGEYELIIVVNDMLSSREYKNKRKIIVKETELKREIKEPLYTETTFLKGNQLQKTLPEDLSATYKLLDFNQPYTAFARFKWPDADSLSINVRLYKKDKDQKSLMAQGFVDPKINEDSTVCMSYLFPYEQMDEGDYSVRFTVESGNKNFEIERDFSILWFTKPLYLYKVDLAIRPMKYLISPAEMEKVKDMNLDELKKWFDDYWKKRDPTPETVYNELMTEFYVRVTEAVRKYSTRFKEGWQTDRGMVLLLYGEPTEVENRKYAANSIPHIIWKYKQDGADQVFTFVDKDQTGEFTLIDKSEEDAENEK